MDAFLADPPNPASRLTHCCRRRVPPGVGEPQPFLQLFHATRVGWAVKSPARSAPGADCRAFVRISATRCSTESPAEDAGDAGAATAFPARAATAPGVTAAAVPGARVAWDLGRAMPALRDDMRMLMLFLLSTLSNRPKRPPAKRGDRSPHSLLSMLSRPVHRAAKAVFRRAGPTRRARGERPEANFANRGLRDVPGGLGTNLTLRQVRTNASIRKRPKPPDFRSERERPRSQVLSRAAPRSALRPTRSPRAASAHRDPRARRSDRRPTRATAPPR